MNMDVTLGAWWKGIETDSRFSWKSVPVPLVIILRAHFYTPFCVLCDLRFCTAPEPPSSGEALDIPTPTHNMKIRPMIVTMGRINCFTKPRRTGGVFHYKSHRKGDIRLFLFLAFAAVISSSCSSVNLYFLPILYQPDYYIIFWTICEVLIKE